MEDMSLNEAVDLLGHVTALSEAATQGAITYLTTEIPDVITREHVEERIDETGFELVLDDEAWEGFLLWEKVVKEMMLVVRITRDRRAANDE